MARGIRLLGWLFIVCGILSLSDKELMAGDHVMQPIQGDHFLEFIKGDHLMAKGHLCMAIVFGGLHFAYGAYLYFTERKSIAA